MKRLLALALAVMLVVSLCACKNGKENSDTSTKDSAAAVGQPDPAQIRENYQKAVSYIERIIDVSKMQSSEENEEGSDAPYKYWYLSEPMDSVELSRDILIDGEKITFGTTTVNDLKSTKFTVETSGEKIPENQALSVRLIKGEQDCNLYTGYNYSGKEIPAEKVGDEAICEGIFNVSEYALPFDFSGIKPDSSFEDIVKILGTPNSTLQVSCNGAEVMIYVGYSNSEGKDGSIQNMIFANLSYNADDDTSSISTIQYFRRTI